MGQKQSAKLCELFIQNAGRARKLLCDILTQRRERVDPRGYAAPGGG